MTNMTTNPISRNDAQGVVSYLRKNLQWLRRYEGDKPGVPELVDRIQAAIDGVEINYQEDQSNDIQNHTEPVHAAR